MKKIMVSIALMLGIASTAQAAEGNADNGKAKSAICVACHGADGNSLVPMYPSLAGQSAAYIAKQLADFKKGASTNGAEGRHDPVMAGMVMALSEQDMKDLGAYYASLAGKPGKGKASALGKTLYLEGDSKKGITACASCHGNDGAGLAAAGFPSVKSQSVDYLKSQLNKFKSGDRKNDLNGMMRTTARKLKAPQIEALAQYMASLK